MEGLKKSRKYRRFRDARRGAIDERDFSATPGRIDVVLRITTKYGFLASIFVLSAGDLEWVGLFGGFGDLVFWVGFWGECFENNFLD